MMVERMQERDEDRSVTAEIARVLAGRIVSGVLAPGVRLRQDHVAAEFGASHVPVREAFQRLDALGLVVTEPRRGVRVAPMDAADVLEVSEMRAELEGLALRHAAARLTAEDFRAARAVGGDLEAANQAFHRILTLGVRDASAVGIDRGPASRRRSALARGLAGIGLAGPVGRGTCSDFGRPAGG